MLGLVILSQQAFCQQATLDNFNLKKQKINKNGFLILGSWSAANIIYGSIATSQTQGSNKYFHQMNAIWNGITLAFVAAGYLGAKKESGLSYEQALKKQATIEKIFLFNAGLDVAYIAVGFYLKERSKTTAKNPDRLKGHGESVALQGSALLLFDVMMYSIHNSHGKQLYEMANKVQLATTENGIGLLVKL
ncbi:MAG: hypothetical protein ABJA37_00355 [Ferruginibacter sp.]